MSEKLRAAHAAVSAARKKLTDVLAADYPTGASVSWRPSNGRIQQGKVLRHNLTDKLQVQNGTTHKIYWICVFDILQAMS